MELKLEPQEQHTLTLTSEEIVIIVNQLSLLPYHQVSGIIENIGNQLKK